MENNDNLYLQQAYNQALLAQEAGEIPVGAVIVQDDRIIAKGHNLTKMLNDVTAHAEMQAITSATSFLGGMFLPEATLYVTLEPCAMCISAISWAKIKRVVYAAKDEQKGFMCYEQILKANNKSMLYPKLIVEQNKEYEEKCQKLVKDFFAKKR